MLGLRTLNRLLHKAPNTFIDALVVGGIIKKNEAQQLQNRSNEEIEKILIGNNRADAEKIAILYSTYLNFPYVKLVGMKIPREALNLVPESVAQAYRVIPFELQGNVLKLAVGEPARLQFQAPAVIQELNKIKGVTVSIFVTTSKDIEWALKLYKPDMSEVDKMKNYGSALTIAETGKVTKSGLPYIDLMPMNIPFEVLMKFPKEVSEKYKMVVFGVDPLPNVSPVPKKIKLAILDPANPQGRDIIEFIKKRNGIHIEEYECSKDGLAKALAGFNLPKENRKVASQSGADVLIDEKSEEKSKLESVKSDDSKDSKDSKEAGEIKNVIAPGVNVPSGSDISTQQPKLSTFKPAPPTFTKKEGDDKAISQPVMQGPKMVVLGGGIKSDEPALHNNEEKNEEPLQANTSVMTVKPQVPQAGVGDENKDSDTRAEGSAGQHSDNIEVKEQIKPEDVLKRQLEKSNQANLPPQVPGITHGLRQPTPQTSAPTQITAMHSATEKVENKESENKEEKKLEVLPEVKASPQKKIDQMRSIAGTVLKPAEERIKEGITQPYSTIQMKPVEEKIKPTGPKAGENVPEIKAEDIQVQEGMVMPEEEMATQNLEESNLDKFLSKPVNSVADLERVIKVGMVPEIIAAVVSLGVGLEISDVHIEAGQDNVRIRYRMDGMLRDVIRLPLAFHAPLVSRIKILAKLKIDEQRIPQDGRFNVTVRDHDIDLRISTLPTIHGEKVVMRILDKSTGILTLEDLGITGKAFEMLVKNIEKPYGVVLATGPTGSGKSTTLYAVLQRISQPTVNIITLEDPVEYEIPGINQTQVKPQIGFSFAEGLRSVLRQDPNVIMVGEIRDLETASMATHAALTGHLVLSTLHTNDSAGALPRLINMGVEPFLITSSVNCILAQRLVRKVCQKCKQEETIPSAVMEDIKKEISKLKDAKIAEAEVEELKFYKGQGCGECTNGYHGRLGIYEVLPMSDKIEELAVDKSPANVIQVQAIKEGMITMKQDGILKALKGITTMDEVLRVTQKD